MIFYNLNDSRKVLNYLEKAVGESRLSSAAMLLVQDEQSVSTRQCLWSVTPVSSIQHQWLTENASYYDYSSYRSIEGPWEGDPEEMAARNASGRTEESEGQQCSDVLGPDGQCLVLGSLSLCLPGV